MTTAELPGYVDRLPGWDRLVETVRLRRGTTCIEGLSGGARSLVLARLATTCHGQLLIVTHSSDQAQRIYDDLLLYSVPGIALKLLPATQHMWLRGEVTDHRALGDRIGALSELASGRDCVVVCTADGLLQRVGPAIELTSSSVTVAPGDTLSLAAVRSHLAGIGYSAETSVARPGQFSSRGGILDIYPIDAEQPVRLDMFGDVVESLRLFDVATQRSADPVDKIVVPPAREVVLTPERLASVIPALSEAADNARRYLVQARAGDALRVLERRLEDDLMKLGQGATFDGMEEYLPYLAPEGFCALDYADPQKLVAFIDDPELVTGQCERLVEEIAETRGRRRDGGEVMDGPEHGGFLSHRLSEAMAIRPAVIASRSPRREATGPDTIRVTSAAIETFRSRLSFFADEARRWQEHGADCYVLTDQPQRVSEICTELKAPAAVLQGRLRQGFKFPEIGLYVITDLELFGATRAAVSSRRARGGIPLSTILDLRLNDYVVHIHQGIGIYRGIVRRTIEGAERDYLLIQYAGPDKLYVPADQIDRLQRYMGGEEARPQINRIGGADWQRTIGKAREKAKIMARDLINLYAARKANQRPSYGPDTNWQMEMEEAFPYDETPSQLRAIEEVKQDLMGTRPADRLICGDVGFGKTEVAVRAAFKAVEAGKQVAVMCPTTILAAQHHTTFSERLAAYPVGVELLSRFRSRAEQKRAIEGLRQGTVDIVVGTQRLLSKDVEFRDLGMLIVDEEQRFGVAQKERLKELRKTVDVITLSATPIPRTLNIALSGLREMSTIEDPPTGRLPIITYVREYDEGDVRDAIIREMDRGGQVYFVHNRVDSIEHVAQRVQALVPEARIRVGHGQMSEDELEEIMHEFYHHEYDVLVCTTIIESGLDIPNVNTILLDSADTLGLAQLYQLRGRVGRSYLQAYAYLFHKPFKKLTDVAQQRLMAIRDFTALGSGYNIAMRDLEIRGAGNLLGAEQSGAMLSVGFDMYCQLLEEAVATAKGEPVEDQSLPPVDLPITCNIPDTYIPNEAERIFFYKRMAGVRDNKEISALEDELIERFGDPPKPVWDSLALLGLRVWARRIGVSSIRGERTRITISFAGDVRLSQQSIEVLHKAFRGPEFRVNSVVLTMSSPNVLAEVEKMLAATERALSVGRAGRIARH